MSDEAEKELPNDFDYDGRLVFNSLRKTKIKNGDADELRERLVDGLYPFSRGKPRQKGEGFTDIHLAEISESQPTVTDDDELQGIAKNIIDQQYIEESYSGTTDNEIVDEEGQSTVAWLRQTKKAYVYWNYPDHVFIQGANEKAKDTATKVNSALGENVEMEDISLHPDFFLWLLYRYDMHDGDLYGDTRSGPLEIQRLATSETFGELKDFGRRNRVEDSDNIALSVPLIAAILHNMNIRLLEGNFRVNGYRIRSKLTSSGQINEGSGRVHVKSSGDIESAGTRLRRLLISLLFTRELVKLYEEWLEFDPKNKYPPLTYFDQMAKSALDENVDLTEIDFTGLITEYAGKRGEEPNPDDFEYLV